MQVNAGYTSEDGHKVAVSSPELVPAGIILDAELTLSTPERLWLSTGLRALDHAVGASPLFHPPGRTFDLKVLRREPVPAVRTSASEAPLLRRTRGPLHLPPKVQSRPQRHRGAPEAPDRVLDEPVADEAGEV